MYYQVNTRKDVNIAVQNIVPGQYNAILEMADGPHTIWESNKAHCKRKREADKD